MPLPDASVRHTPSRLLSGADASSGWRRWWPLAGGIVLIVAGLGLWRDTALDAALFHAVNALGPAAPMLWSSLSVAGLGLSAWIYLTAFAHRQPARVAQLLWILVAGGIVIHVIKRGMHTPRPLLGLGDAAVNVVGESLRTQSMPSGHSAMAFAMLALVLAGRPASAGRGLAVPQVVGWVALAVGIALSRLAVGAHWPADALFGAGLGLLFGGFAPRAWPVRALARLLAAPSGQRLVAIGLAVSTLAIVATPRVLAVLGLAQSTLEKRLSTGYPLAEPLQWLLALVAAIGAVRWWRAAARPAPAESTAAAAASTGDRS